MYCNVSCVSISSVRHVALLYRNKKKIKSKVCLKTSYSYHDSNFLLISRVYQDEEVHRVPQEKEELT